jgi:hypothetical protein
MSNRYEPPPARSTATIQVVAGSAEAARAAPARTAGTILVAMNESALDAITRVIARERRRNGSLLVPFVPRGRLLPALYRVFRRVAFYDATIAAFDPVNLPAVLARRDSGLLLGAMVDEFASIITLCRGDLSLLSVPWEWFEAQARTSLSPSEQVAIGDEGRTILIGSCSFAVDDAVAAMDPVYRRFLRRRRWEASDDLGGRIRRRRLQMRLRREDFPGIDAKTLARIERGEIRRPQRETLRLIAQTLGVPLPRILAPESSIPEEDALYSIQTDTVQKN